MHPAHVIGLLVATAAPVVAQQAPAVIITGVTIFPAPGVAPIENGVIVVENGRIASIGSARDVRVPAAARTIDCRGCSAFAGFWNLHVHFSQPGWAGADTASAARLTARFRSMLLRWGFVHVLDTGSFLESTLALKRRIELGDVDGPEIKTAGPPFAPAGGTPFYLAPVKLPELVSAAAATESVKVRLGKGADFIKIFASSPVARGQEVTMPLDIIRAVTAEAHRQHRLVAAHPTSNRGAEAAMEGGVDLLLHTTPDSEQPWDSSLVRRLVASKIALAPTLKLWKWELERAKRPAKMVDEFVHLAEQQVGAFAKAGGDVVFGTDVGYVSDYDPTDEYRFLGEAGLDFDAVLGMLTTTPARRLGASIHAGRLQAGADADIVLTAGRPDRDLTAFAAVRYAWRAGRLVYEANP